VCFEGGELITAQPVHTQKVDVIDSYGTSLEVGEILESFDKQRLYLQAAKSIVKLGLTAITLTFSENRSQAHLLDVMATCKDDEVYRSLLLPRRFGRPDITDGIWCQICEAVGTKLTTLKPPAGRNEYIHNMWRPS
jgi:hypothetical protein